MGAQGLCAARRCVFLLLSAAILGALCPLVLRRKESSSPLSRAPLVVGMGTKDGPPASPDSIRSAFHQLKTEHLPETCGVSSLCTTSFPAFDVPIGLRTEKRWAVAVKNGILLSQSRGSGPLLAWVAPRPPDNSLRCVVVIKVLTDEATVTVRVTYAPDVAIALSTYDALVARHVFPQVAYIPDANMAPIVVFIDSPLQQANIDWLRDAVSPRALVLYNVSRFWRLPADFDVEKEHVLHLKGWGWGYRFMCQFWFAHVWGLPGIRDLEYLMRLDSDSILSAAWSADPFDLMRKNGALYMRNTITNEAPYVVRGLRDLVLNYTNENGITPANEHLWNLATNPHNMKMLYNNFQVVNMAWLHSKDVQDWIARVMHTRHILRKRWGDAPLITLAVAMFVPPDKLLARNRNVMPYSHNGRL